MPFIIFSIHGWRGLVEKGFRVENFSIELGGDAVRGERKKKIVFQKARIQTAQRANTHTYTSCGACLFINAHTDVYVPR